MECHVTIWRGSGGFLHRPIDECTLPSSTNRIKTNPTTTTRSTFKLRSKGKIGVNKIQVKYLRTLFGNSSVVFSFH